MQNTMWVTKTNYPFNSSVNSQKTNKKYILYYFKFCRQVVPWFFLQSPVFTGTDVNWPFILCFLGIRELSINNESNSIT